jgi:hypothetical protein
MIHKAAGQGLTIHVKGLAFCAMHKSPSCICEPVHKMAGQGPGTPAAGGLYASGCPPRISLGNRTATLFAENPAPAPDAGNDERPQAAEQRASLRLAAAVQYQQRPDSSVMNEFARHEQQRRYVGLLASRYVEPSSFEVEFLLCRNATPLSDLPERSPQCTVTLSGG